MKKSKRKFNVKYILNIGFQLLIGGIIGVLIGQYVITSSVSFFAIILFFVIFYILGIVVHEAGHLVFGLATGYRFSLFRLFSFAWFKENEKIKFTISKNFALGQCLLSPSDRFEDFKFILYNLGGVIAQLILCALLFVSTLLLPAKESINAALYIGIGINLLVALINLIPMKNQEVPNDGANIVEALKSEEATYAFYLMFHVNAKLMEGKTMKTFDLSTFDIDEHADLDNYLIAYKLLLKVAWLEEHGQFEQALSEYLRLDLEKLPKFYRDAVMMDLVYYYCILIPDHDQAKLLYEDQRLKNKWKMKFPATLKILTAYHAMILLDQVAAEKFLADAKKASLVLPNEGSKKMQLMSIQFLEEKIKAAKAESAIPQ